MDTPPLSRHMSRDRTASAEIDDLISDAMEDASPTLTRSFMGSEETTASKSFVVSNKMEVRMTGDSMTIDFDSDTDEENSVESQQRPWKSATSSRPDRSP